MRILYVDDEVVNLRLMRDVFSLLLGQPDAVATAQDGAQAVQLLEKERFDVIICDQRMPGMSGTELIAALQRLRPELHAVLLTAFGDRATCTAAVRARAENVLAKPLHVMDLRRVLEEALG